MSKKRNKHKGNKDMETRPTLSAGVPQPEGEELRDDDVETPGSEPAPSDDGTDVGDGEQADAPAPEASDAGEGQEPAPAAAEPVKAAQPEVKPTDEAKKEPVKAPAPVQKEKVMSEEILNGGRSFIARRRADTKHTPAGLNLMKKFDEYEAIVISNLKPTEEQVKLRADKLVEVFNVACPTLNTDIQTATDLARVAFDRVMGGWGKIYSENTIFAGDYTSTIAKKSPELVDRLNIYFTAIIQLVDGVLEKNRVMFDADRIGKILKNNGVATALLRLRDGVNTRNGYTNLHK